MSRFVRFIAWFLFLVLPTSVYCYGDASIPNSLDEAIQKLFRSHELLPSIGGLKPITNINCPFCKTPFQGSFAQVEEKFKAQLHALNMKYLQEVQETFEYLKHAQTSGVLYNPDLQFIYVPEYNGEGAFIALVNKVALERLLHDKEALDVLAEFKVAPPKTNEEAILLFEKAANAGGFNSGPSWANVTVGIIMGYPPSDVRLYARSLEAGNVMKYPRLPHPEGGYGFGPRDQEVSMSSFANLSTSDPARKKYLFESGKTLLKNFKQLRSDGKSFTDIYNSPAQLVRGVGDYPIIRTEAATEECIENFLSGSFNHLRK